MAFDRSRSQMRALYIFVKIIEIRKKYQESRKKRQENKSDINCEFLIIELDVNNCPACKGADLIGSQ